MTPWEIRALRRSLGLSQQKFADMLNEIDPEVRASMSAVSRWEHGSRHPSSNTITAMKRLAGKGVSLTEALSAQALAAEREAELAFQNGQPDIAVDAIRRARQLRRMAFER